MKTHCQPTSPRVPLRSSKGPLTAAPSMFPNALPSVNFYPEHSPAVRPGKPQREIIDHPG